MSEQFPLEVVQRWMQFSLLEPNSEAASSAKIERVITRSTRLSSTERFGIYQQGYRLRLLECMSKQFPALQYALGEDLFRAFSDRYLSTYPSESFTLGKLGIRFPQFLSETRPDKDASPQEREDWPNFLIELAQFEITAFTLFDEVIEEVDPHATLSTDDERIALSPTLRLFEYTFPINAYYQAVSREESPTLPYPSQSFVAMVRKEFRLGMFDLNPLQYQFLTIMQNGAWVSEAVELLANQADLSSSEVRKLWNIWRECWIPLGFFIELPF